MKSSTPHSIVYGEFGRFPFEIQIKTTDDKIMVKDLEW